MYEEKYDKLKQTFKKDDLLEITKTASNFLGPQMIEKESYEIKIRNIIQEIGKMQMRKNNLL